MAEDIIKDTNDLLEVYSSLRHTASEEHSLASKLFFSIQFLVLKAYCVSYLMSSSLSFHFVYSVFPACAVTS